jgi:hypothetical protein
MYAAFVTAYDEIERLYFAEVDPTKRALHESDLNALTRAAEIMLPPQDYANFEDGRGTR